MPDSVEAERRLEQFRSEQGQAMHALRNEMHQQFSKLDDALDTLADNIRNGYVDIRFFEEVRRNQGERTGDLEERMARIEAASENRFSRCQADLDALAKAQQKKWEDKDKENKADRRLIFTALVAPFIFMVLGLLAAAAGFK